MRWSVKKAVEAILEAKDRVTDEELYQIGEEARHKLLRKAQVKGTIVHSYVQGKAENLDPTYIEPEYRPYYEAFLKFLKDHELAPIFQERTVHNHHWKYAGRLDFYGYLDGIPVLIDFKTSKSLRAEYGLQLAAYKECLTNLGYPVQATYILHLRESGRYTLKEYNEPFFAFTNLIPVFNWKLDKEKPRMEVASEEEAIKKEEATDFSITSPEPTEHELEPSALDELLNRNQIPVVAQRFETVAPEFPSVPPTVKRKRGRPRKYPLPPLHPTEIELQPT